MVRQSALSQRPARAPRFVPFLNPIAARLLRIGPLMGPNALITVRGRKSGEPRTTPVALVERDGRRWVIGTFGEVNWVRNLRAAHSAEIAVGRRREAVRASELSADEAARFFRDVLAPYVSDGLLKRLVLWILGAGDVVTDPTGAAQGRPVFELTPANPLPSGERQGQGAA
jgi:deazaflavin-dependent oxidoreductase (nitroreductase family)